MVRIVAFILLFLHVSAFAQQKQMSLEDAIWGRYTNLRPESMNGLAWRNASAYTYLKADSLIQALVKNDKEEVLLTKNDLETITGATFRAFPFYSWLSDNEIVVLANNTYFVINQEKKELSSKYSYPEEVEEIRFSKEGSFLAFVENDNLFLTLANGEQRQITSDGGNGIVNGKSVHRNEFGINGGIFPSPEGNYLAFYRKNETMVKDYPLVDFMTREAEYTPVKYPMAGMKSHHVTLGVYNIETGKTVFLKTGELLDHYLTNVAWSPDEKYIYMAELNREQNHMQLNCY
ncbi:MAG TPA: DPP IV N-terminal domain-containing protein, partial [Draconibacterium sp.]|nr:DPP IV N-terminal domain-containing protein [Draconibacterium sp.]